MDTCSIDECNENSGTLGDLPIAADWNGTGTEEIGNFRPRRGQLFLDLNGNGKLESCRVDKCFDSFGRDGDLPVAGDWDATGNVRIGVFRPSTGE